MYVCFIRGHQNNDIVKPSDHHHNVLYILLYRHSSVKKKLNSKFTFQQQLLFLL